MKWRVYAFLLALILGGGGAVAAQAEVLTAPSSGPVLATTSAVLYQQGDALWQTTVMLSQAGAECPGPASAYWLETTSPEVAIQAFSAVRVEHGPCRVTVTFKGVPKILESASLVLDEAGALSSAQLTVSRNVTLSDYFFIPIICGLLMAIVLLLVIRFRAGTQEEDGLRIAVSNHEFRTKTVAASQAPQVSLVPVATIIATILGAGTLANSLFPGVPIEVFLLLTVVVQAVTVAGGRLIYSLLHGRWVNRHPPNEIGLPLALTSGGNPPNFSFPADPSIKSTKELVMTSDGAGTTGQQGYVTLPANQKIPIPDGSKIEILEGTSLSFPDGPTILIKGEGSLRVSNDADGAELKFAGAKYELPRIIRTQADTTIEYMEATEPDFSPGSAKVGGRRRYRRQNFKLTQVRHSEPQTNVLISLIPALVAVFGIGAELGIIGVLSIVFSDASGFGRFIAFDLIAAVAVFVIFYVVWKIQNAPYAQQNPAT